MPDLAAVQVDSRRWRGAQRDFIDEPLDGVPSEQIQCSSRGRPSSSFAPIALTPDELGLAWRDGRVHLRLHVRWNGERFGAPHGGGMDFGFGELIAHAARTRRLSAGTVIGSGTVSNADRAAGSACIAERRVLEILEHGAPRTAFMRFGDSVQMQAQCEASGDTPLGRIAQRVLEFRP